MLVCGARAHLAAHTPAPNQTRAQPPDPETRILLPKLLCRPSGVLTLCFDAAETVARIGLRRVMEV